MAESTERLSFTLEQELADGTALPDCVQLLPSGEVKPKGKTQFLVDGEARRLIVEAFANSATDLVIDYEHQSLSGSEAPAAGWIKGLEDRGEGGIWATVQWTDRAKEYLANREYRYISPVVLIRKKDGRAVELLGAALTNLPAIDGMEPVVNARSFEAGAGDYEEKFAAALGLLGLPEGSGLDEISERVNCLSAKTGFVPESEYLAVKQELREKEADLLIKEALSSGRLAPALAGWAREYAARDFDGFTQYMSRAPKALPIGSDEWRTPALTGAQRQVTQLLGIREKTLISYLQAEA